MLNFRNFIPVGGIILLVTFLIGSHTIFHWTHDGIADLTHPFMIQSLQVRRIS